LNGLIGQSSPASSSSPIVKSVGANGSFMAISAEPANFGGAWFSK
jgi:hypothetical protein